MAGVRPSVSGEENLQARLNRNDAFTQAELLSLIDALAGELRDTHRHGGCHGTITPADIRYDDAGSPRLGGWGRDTTPDAMLQSPFAPIERYVPVHPQGSWTDVYALAAILWRAITGGPPAAVLHRKGDVTLERLAPAGYEPRFLRGVDAALAIAPQQRPHDLDSWLAMLTTRSAMQATGVAPSEHRPAGATAAAGDAAPRRAPRWPRAALAAGIVAAVGGGVYLAGPVEQRLAPTGARPADRGPAAPAAPAATVAAAPDPVALPDAAAGVGAVAPPATSEMAAPPAAAPRPAAAMEAPPPAPRTRPEAVTPRAPVAAAPDPAPPSAAIAAVEPPAAFDPPVALLRRADDRLRRLYRDYDRLNARIARSYRDAKIPYDAKARTYQESRGIQAALAGLRDDRNGIAGAASFAVANRRYDRLAEDITRVRDRIELLRRTL